MEKVKNSLAWTELGYDLFANEGIDGLQVERLARILQLNKSGFYHYFGDLEGFCAELISLHKKKVSYFLQEVNLTQKIDPDYLLLLIKHAATVMFQVQLTRNKNGHSFYQESEKVDRRVDVALRDLWTDFLGIQNNPDLAMRYYDIVRDMFYTRISFQNLNYPFLHNLVTDAKLLIQEISRRVVAEL
jgi:AcrR family transcriptional regulator